MTAKLIWINDLIGELRMLFETTGALFGKCRSRPPSYLGRLGQAMARRHLVARALRSAALRLGRSVRLGRAVGSTKEILKITERPRD